jgi:DMSO/TMAO reductase YedYZ molybdopterin-dependent catalytic subunit
MKKIIALLLIALVVACTAIAEDGYFVLCRPEPGNVVYVRKKPRTDATVVVWLEFGSYVKTDGKERNGFIHVVDLAAEDPEGWVYAGFLVPDEPQEGTYKARVNGRVNARKCVDGKRIATLYDGKVVTVYACSDEWCVTNKGYVMREWLSEVEP